MEIIIKLLKKIAPKVVLFDFDGTISTLRHGWESIMEPMMLEMIAGSDAPSPALIERVRKYIDSSTGIQTIYQMQWLAHATKESGKNPALPNDPWWYKNEYNKKLMVPVNKRRALIEKGSKIADDFLIKGSVELLEKLKENGIKIYVASGTDDPDVKAEAEILGVKKYFDEIVGAPPGKSDCSKEAVLRKLIEINGFKGQELAVIGDGKVEIALGREFKAMALGLASDEEKRCGVNEKKRERLIKAGAHAIAGDFQDTAEILSWLGLT